MAKIVNNTPITAGITPGSDDRNQWATHYAKYGAGGFEMVENESDVQNISADRLKDKMVYVKTANKFMHHNGSVWVDSSITGSGSVPQSVLDDIAANKAEISRIRTDISVSTETVYTYRGSVAPTDILSAKHKAYYLTFYNLGRNDFTISIPNPPAGLDDGTILSIDNNDKTNPMYLAPSAGHTINNKSGNFKMNPDTFLFIVKNGTDWNVAFSGYLPRNLSTIVTAIKSKLSGSLNTIDEIQAALKDRLHTFREIQDEFQDQLHTLPAIEQDMVAKGFSKGFSLGYGYLSTATPPHDLDWVDQHINPNQEVLVPATNEGQKYLAIYLPVYIGVLIEEVLLNSQVKETTEHDIVVNDADYKVLVLNDLVDTSATNRMKLEYHSQGAITGGIEIDDGATNKAGIKKVNIEGAKISKVSNDSDEVTVTNGVDIHMMAPNQQYGNALANEITILPPLNVYDDASVIGKDNSVKLELMPGTFAPVGAPGFLGYIAEDTEVVGKLGTDEVYHKGALWFDDVIVPTGTYLQSDRVNKAYGIQDYSNDDPNVTGGVNFLIAFHVGLKGKAPNDGKIRIALVKKNMSAFDDGIGYLEDVNGQPMAVEKHYKTGDELGTLEVVGVVNAKGLQEFQAIIADNFSSDLVVLLDRTENGTGLMIQSIGHDATHSDQKGKTGDALQQFELDTMQNIEFSSHYLGVDRMTMGWVNSRPDSVKSYTAGTHFISVDGWRLINPKGIKVGVVDGHTQIQDDGVHIAEFNWGKIFSAEETQMLRGHTIDVSTTLVDKDSGYEIALMKWTGKPDEFTPEIFTSRNNDTPILQANWVKADSLFISEDVVSGDHTEAKTMTVPSDANNYAIIIYPVAAESPMTLKLKELKVDVNPAFTGYAIHYPELAGNLHLEFDPEYKEFRQDSQGYASLRYTLNNTPASGLPMPCGEDKNGRADIEIDTTVNQISGSAARGGEGALKFTIDGEVTIQTELLLWNEQISTSTTTFWWSTVSPDGNTFTKIADSETTFEVPTGSVPSKFSMKPFKLAVENGDRIALRGLTDSVDGAFLESKSSSAPMVTTKIQFKELTTGDSGDTPQDMVLQSDLSSDFSVDVDTNQVTIPQLGDLSDRVDDIDLELVITPAAKAGGWYIELDYDTGTGRPVLSPKQRNP